MEKGAGDEIINRLLLQESLCSLATASKEGEPEVATIEFVADKDYNIYFVTHDSYRKFKNLKENPRASIAITEVPHTVQMQGTVVELQGEDVDFLINYMSSKLGQNPGLYSKDKWKFMKFIPSDMKVAKYPKWPSRFETDPRTEA